MKATTMTWMSFLAVGLLFSVAHSQPSSQNNTAHIDRAGSIVKQNPTNWISAVAYQSSDGVGARGAYQVTFHDAAPSASSCTATPDNSDLIGQVVAPDAEPNELIVSFHQSGSSGGLLTPMPSAFTLSCQSSSS